LVILGSLLLFLLDWFNKDEKARRWGWNLFRLSVVLQGIVVAALFYGLKTVTDVAQRIPAREYSGFGQWLAKQMSMSVPAGREAELAQRWLEQNSTSLTMKSTSNPVEFGALIGLFVVLLLVALFAWRREDVIDSMPELKTIDSLLYRTVGVAFPLLTLLLITGAVWANESWGRYWGWDSKEVGALVAWMAYAGFLHTRIAHGWRGRRSAYFALLGFALVIFTWLGVSYLLPGLHSYA
ncbi:MAG TPA: cytochrome c biogenesis protein CcsA, partial [Blastocatellia bacterium]|nr:cytochrome c biogenesis protein CcsA [Blastocatellia bacterium]